jgi:hypothetical protein
MSRGPGIWQRALLERIAEGKAVIVTGSDQTHADQNAIRRAAHKLEDAGKLKLIAHKIDGINRLVAVPVDLRAPEPRRVTGLDGKTYLVPPSA